MKPLERRALARGQSGSCNYTDVNEFPTRYTHTLPNDAPYSYRRVTQTHVSVLVRIAIEIIIPRGGKMSA